MLRLVSPDDANHLTRREWLRAGAIGLGGMTLSHLLTQRAGATPSPKPARPKSVIIFGLLGGPGQHDTWDPRPDAPAEVRGLFGTTQSRSPHTSPGRIPVSRWSSTMARTWGVRNGSVALTRAGSTGF